MRKTRHLAPTALGLALLVAPPAAAHHGFRGYDSAVVTVTGKVGAVKFVNPHVTIALTPAGAEAPLEVLFPPPWSMISRGLPEDVLREGKTVTVDGNLNKRDPHELLAERMQIDGKTVVFRGGLATSEVALAMHADPLLFPIVEIVHIMALALVVGASAMFDLRLLGVARKIRATKLARFLLPWSLGAFGVSLLSGLLLVLSDLEAYLDNRSFQVKILLIALAGCNALAFRLTLFRGVEAWDDAVMPPWRARIFGVVSLVLWAGVIAAGRLIAYS